MSTNWRQQNREISSSSSGSVRQRFHFGDLTPFHHCHCGNELSLQTSWSSDNPGRRFWVCVAINGMQGCGFVYCFDPPMCSRSRKIIPKLLKRINQNEEEIERLKALLRRANVPKKASCGKVFQMMVILFFLVAIGVFMVFNVIAIRDGIGSRVYRH